MKKCPACDRSYDDSQSFCLEDGTSLNPEPQTNSQATVVLPRKKSKLPLILGGLLLLIGAGAVAWFLLFSRAQTSNQSNKQTAVNVPPPVSTPTLLPTDTPTPTPSPSVSPDSNANSATNSTTNTETNSKPPSESNSTKPLPSLMKAEEHSVVFNLQQCRKSGTSITCDFTITNTGQDRRFRLSTYNSKLFDELGNGYKGADAQVANQAGDAPEIGFINGVTTKSQMTFENIEPNAAKITLLTFSFAVGNDNDLAVKFRNVPLVIGK